MIYALKGIIEEIGDNFIIINVRDVYYQLLVSHPEDFMFHDERLVYTYQEIGRAHV